jgi:hypothetical protein
MEARSFQSPQTRIVHDNREFLFARLIGRTLEAYENMNRHDNCWFIEAVHQRITNSRFIVEATVEEGITAGYIGVDHYRVFGVGLVGYIGIAAVFAPFKKQGIMQYLLGSLEGYDGIMMRTQNPNMASAMYQVFGYCSPISGRPATEMEKRCGEMLARESNGNYDRETMVWKELYNGACLTGVKQSGRPAFNDALYSRIDPMKGDAIVLVSLFRPQQAGPGGF